MKKWAYLLLMTTMSTGCLTSIKSHNRQNALEKGIQYFLPRTMLSVQVPYTIVDKTAYKAGVAGKPTRSIFIEKPIIIEARNHADARYPLVIESSESENAPMLETKFGFKVGDNGLLLAVDSIFKDHTGDFVQNLVGAAVAVAKMVATAAAGDVPTITKRINELPAAIAAAVAIPVDPKADKQVQEARLAKVQLLQKELTVLLEVQSAVAQANREEEKRSEATLTFLIDPEQFKECAAAEGKPPEYQYQYQIKALQVFRKASGTDFQPDDQVPVVTLKMKLAKQDFVRPDSNPIGTESVSGVVYRSPMPVEFRVESKDSDSGTVRVASTGVLLLSQFGHVNLAELRSKRGGDRETHVSFNAGGTLTEYRVESSSSADRMLQKIAASADVLQKTIGDVRYGIPTDAAKARTARDEAEADQLTKDTTRDLRRETDELKAQIANEQAKAELKKLQDAKGGAR